MAADHRPLSKKLVAQGLSGLTGRDRQDALRLCKQAAMLGHRKAPSIHYTQGPRRWEGINDTDKAWKGEYPNYADCSAFATWCIWNGTGLHFGLRDNVNGANWKAGYTGTQANHGKRVKRLRRGDLVLYGNPWGGTGHVAVYVGFGMVVSHGSEGGPYLARVKYRSDIYGYFRYI